MKIFVTVLLCVALAVFGWVSWFQSHPVMRDVGAKPAVHASSVAALENASDIIVRATMLRNEKMVLDRANPFAAPDAGVAYTRFHVNAAWKGGDLGGEFIVGEPYYAYTNLLAQKTVMRVEGYVPASVGRTYILFLKRAEDGTIGLTGAWQGKYLVSATALERMNAGEKLKPADLDASSKEFSAYLEMWKEIMDTYGKQTPNMRE